MRQKEMAIMKYFNDIKDIKDLKKRYKKLARELHPDLGGSEEEFKAMTRNDF